LPLSVVTKSCIILIKFASPVFPSSIKRAQHVQDEGALRINDALGGMLALGPIQPFAQLQRSRVVGAAAELILLQDGPAFTLPELLVCVTGRLSRRQEQGG